jgi:hypothetical protein
MKRLGNPFNACRVVTSFSLILVLVAKSIFGESLAVRHGNTGYLADNSLRSKIPSLKAQIGTRNNLWANRRIVGGVAFFEGAEPKEGLTIQELDFSLSDDQVSYPLKFKLNDKWATVPLFAWEILPIVSYVNDEKGYDSAFSLFGGNNIEKHLADCVLYNKGKANVQFIMQYHSAFKDTILGLRLMQMDSFFTDMEAYGRLPVDVNGNTIFGVGEEERSLNMGSITINKNDIQNIALFNKSNKESSFSAYILTSPPHEIEPVRFEIRDNQVFVWGEPYFSFWHEDDVSMFEDDAEKAKVASFLYGNPVLIRENPAVYIAVRNVMRYSSFFRYVKAHNWDLWRNFVSEIKSKIAWEAVRIVRTPDVQFLADKELLARDTKCKDHGLIGFGQSCIEKRDLDSIRRLCTAKKNPIKISNAKRKKTKKMRKR